MSPGAQALARAWSQSLRARPLALLESPGSGPRQRFSLLGGEPLFIFEGRGSQAWLRCGPKRWPLRLAPAPAFERLGRALAQRRGGPSSWPLFCAFSYEAGARLQGVALAKPEPLGLPDWLAFLPGLWARWQPGPQRWQWQAQAMPKGLAKALAKALGLPQRALSAAPDPSESKARVLKALQSRQPASPERRPKPGPLKDNMGAAGFQRRVRQVQRHILDGDVYQVNLGHRFEAAWPGTGLELYQRLTALDPSPMAAFVDLGSVQVASASPERLFKVSGRKVETWPIAGTAPRRAKAPRARQREKAALRRSEKDAAEHVMLVDLERNDLGRVCQTGSVRVPRFKAVESNANVHHLVSRVTGRLLPGHGLPQLLQAAFPGGSITGAPKVRCMQVTRQLEGQRRGWYTGSLGWWDPKAQKADLNILIRTLYVKKGKAYGSLGAGIVLDSKPKKEWEETLAKGRAMFKALGLR